MKWVELIAAHPKHGEVGKKLELVDKDAETLIAAGVAKSCEKPDPQTPAEVESLVKTIKGYIDESVVKLGDQIREEQKTVNTTITKHFGASVPATAKDKELEARGGFKSADEWLGAVIKAGTPGQQADERLYKLDASMKAAQGMNTNAGSEGGFLVLNEVSQSVMEMVFATGNLLSRTDQHPISGSSLSLKRVDETSRATGSRRGGVQAYWMGEAEQYTKSKPKFGELSLKPHKLGVFYYATDEQIADTAGYNLAAKLSQYAAEEINWMVDDAIINGDGVHKPLGILNSGCLVTVTKEGSGNSGNINYQNVVKMYSRMLPSSIGSAVWLVNQDTMPSLLSMTAPNESGTASAWVAGNYYPTIAAAPYGTLLGRPVIPSEHCKTLAAIGDILFVDLSYYATATRGGINSAMSIHLRFDYGETAFRFDFRVDGQPWLQSAITPANGSNTQSPFIALDDAR